VHLSDIHFDATDATLRGPNETARELLLDDLSAGMSALGRPDAVLVTGDIAFSGLEHQYIQAREFLRRVTDTLGLKPEQVQIVPGNHDVDRTLVSGSIGASHRDLRTLEPVDADNLLPEYYADPADPLFAPLAAYRHFAINYGCSVSASSPYWEVDWPIGDTLTLRMRGLTTVMVSNGEDRRANLIVGSLQASLATERRDDIIMVLGHHPPDWWSDADDVETLMRGFASVHLYGHKHRHHFSVIDDSVRVVAGAVHPERKIAWQPRYNWLRLGVIQEGTREAALTVDVWPRALAGDNQFRSDSGGGNWVPDRRSVALPRLRLAAGLAADTASLIEQAAAEATPPALSVDTEVVDAVRVLASRPPVTDDAGNPTALRRAIYAFGGFDSAVQTRILSELGLIDDADSNLTPDELTVRAFARARERQSLDDLVARIENETNPNNPPS
jgi:metallophosphoesterase superfamily enzyme